MEGRRTGEVEGVLLMASIIAVDETTFLNLDAVALMIFGWTTEYRQKGASFLKLHEVNLNDPYTESKVRMVTIKYVSNPCGESSTFWAGDRAEKLFNLMKVLTND